MPFTLLHMGPGLAVKGLAGRRFSLVGFGIAQVAMDIEPLVGMIRGAAVLHGPTHTFLAALLIGAAVALLAPPLCRLILRRWERELAFHGLHWLADPAAAGRASLVLGALVGTLSHVLLDAVMHVEMVPLAPWSTANPWRAWISIDAVNGLCILAGLFGLAAWFAGGWRRR